jgi:hypothetical protein
LTIDATGPQEEAREVSSGGCGSIGRKLPLQIEVEVHGGPSSHKEKTVVEFVLTNSGKQNLRLPISPEPADVEPADSGGDHSFQVLGIRMTSGALHETMLPGGAELYGNEESATLVTLAPGESLRVRAKVALPHVPRAGQKSAPVLVAHAVLSEKTVTTVEGKSFMDCTQDLGYARSPEYTLEALLRSAK